MINPDDIDQKELAKDVKAVFNGKKIRKGAKVTATLKKVMRGFTYFVIVCYLFFFIFAKLGILSGDIFDLPDGAKFHVFNSCQLNELNCVRNIEFVNGSYMFEIKNDQDVDIYLNRFKSGDCLETLNQTIKPGLEEKVYLSCLPERKVFLYYRDSLTFTEKTISGVMVNI